jgi:hypothetical protein
MVHTLILFQLQNVARPGVEEFCLNYIFVMGLKTQEPSLSLDGNKEVPHERYECNEVLNFYNESIF